MKGFIVGAVTGLVLLAGIISCQVKTEEQDTTGNLVASNNKITNSIQKQNDVFMRSFQQGDTRHIVNLYATGAQIMPPNAAPIKGRQGARNYWDQARQLGLTKLELNTNDILVQSDSTAVETGSYKVYAGSGQQVDNGSYMVYWKKEEGMWRLFRDIWNSDNPDTSSTKPQVPS